MGGSYFLLSVLCFHSLMSESIEEGREGGREGRKRNRNM